MKEVVLKATGLPGLGKTTIIDRIENILPKSEYEIKRIDSHSLRIRW